MRWYVWQTRLRCVGVVSERRCQASHRRVGSAGLAGEHVLSTSTAPGGGRPVDCRSARASNTYINDDGRPEGGRDGRRRPNAGLLGAALQPCVRNGEVRRRAVQRTGANVRSGCRCCNGLSGYDERSSSGREQLRVQVWLIFLR